MSYDAVFEKGTIHTKFNMHHAIHNFDCTSDDQTGIQILRIHYPMDTASACPLSAPNNLVGYVFKCIECQMKFAGVRPHMNKCHSCNQRDYLDIPMKQEEKHTEKISPEQIMPLTETAPTEREPRVQTQIHMKPLIPIREKSKRRHAQKAKENNDNTAHKVENKVIEQDENEADEGVEQGEDGNERAIIRSFGNEYSFQEYTKVVTNKIKQTNPGFIVSNIHRAQGKRFFRCTVRCKKCNAVQSDKQIAGLIRSETVCDNCDGNQRDETASNPSKRQKSREGKIKVGKYPGVWMDYEEYVEDKTREVKKAIGDRFKVLKLQRAKNLALQGLVECRKCQTQVSTLCRVLLKRKSNVPFQCECEKIEKTIAIQGSVEQGANLVLQLNSNHSSIEHGHESGSESLVF